MHGIAPRIWGIFSSEVTSRKQKAAGIRALRLAGPLKIDCL
jgi:hypothetical protein